MFLKQEEFKKVFQLRLFDYGCHFRFFSGIGNFVPSMPVHNRPTNQYPVCIYQYTGVPKPGGDGGYTPQ